MLIGRLVALIENHADELTERVVKKVREDPRTGAYVRFDDHELGERAHSVYANLGKWLAETSDEHIEAEYVALGRTRRQEGIPLSQVVMGLLLTRRNLWQFIDSQGADSILELRQQLDLELLVVRFYDRAIYYTVCGYEERSSDQ